MESLLGEKRKVVIYMNKADFFVAGSAVVGVLGLAIAMSILYESQRKIDRLHKAHCIAKGGEEYVKIGGVGVFCVMPDGTAFKMESVLK